MVVDWQVILIAVLVASLVVAGMTIFLLLSVIGIFGKIAHSITRPFL